MSGEQTQVELIDAMLGEHGWTIEYDLSPIDVIPGDAGEWRAVSMVSARLRGSTLEQITSIAAVEIFALQGAVEADADRRAEMHASLHEALWTSRLDTLERGVHHGGPMSEIFPEQRGTHHDFDVERARAQQIGSRLEMDSVAAPEGMSPYLAGTQISEIDAQLERLEVRVGQLRDTLSPILAPQGPSHGIVGVPVDDAPTAPIVAALAGRQARLSRLIGEIEDVLDRTRL